MSSPKKSYQLCFCIHILTFEFPVTFHLLVVTLSLKVVIKGIKFLQSSKEVVEIILEDLLFVLLLLP